MISINRNECPNRALMNFNNYICNGISISFNRNEIINYDIVRLQLG